MPPEHVIVASTTDSEDAARTLAAGVIETKLGRARWLSGHPIVGGRLREDVDPVELARNRQQRRGEAFGIVARLGRPVAGEHRRPVQGPVVVAQYIGLDPAAAAAMAPMPPPQMTTTPARASSRPTS